MDGVQGPNAVITLEVAVSEKVCRKELSNIKIVPYQISSMIGKITEKRLCLKRIFHHLIRPITLIF